MSTRSWTSAEKFSVTYAVEPNSGCWVWLGEVTPEGYPRFNRDGIKGAHRWSYIHFVGPIPEGMEIDHVWDKGCRFTSCVNPDHLEAVTHAENMRRGVRSRTTTCRKGGHPYTPENTSYDKRGGRVCLECERIRDRARRARGAH